MSGLNRRRPEPAMGGWPVHDPQTDPQACVLCSCEDVTEAATMRPSGVGPQITCSNNHTTNGMPTAAHFALQAEWRRGLRL